MMKKILTLVAAALVLLGCSEDRSHILKVYNWADYIDEDLLEEFEEWYFKQTGEKVEIIYQTFDINETMLSKIELGHEDYDVVCPFWIPFHGTSAETALPWLKPTCAEDMYKPGEYMIYTDGLLYRNKVATDHSPTDYPAGWEVQ